MPLESIQPRIRLIFLTDSSHIYIIKSTILEMVRFFLRIKMTGLSQFRDLSLGRGNMSFMEVRYSRIYINKRYSQLQSYTRMNLILFLVLVLSLALAKPIYDFKKSYITNLTPLNYNDQVSKYRQNTHYVSIVQFYKYSDGKSASFAAELDEWNNQYRGIFRTGAVDCEEFSAFCEKEGVTQFPTFRILPPNPIPAINLVDDISVETIQKAAAKYLHSNSIEITNSNINTFLAENPSVPKILLFTDKPKGTPMIYKGLSVAFEKKLNFGLVRSSDKILVDRYAIKKFPSIIVVKTGEKKPIFYTGKQFKFEELFEFLNIYSQVFVPGGGSSLDSSATKEWMTEIFPEMHAKSARDICLGTESTLCVILLTNQEPSKDIKQQFEALNSKFDNKIDRGAKFKFMWLNASLESKWGQIFKYENQDKVVILNPGKRKRYTDHEGQITKDSISITLDTISGGDAKFNRVSELPTFSIRTQ